MKRFYLLLITLLAISPLWANITLESTIIETLNTPWCGFGYNQWGFARESDGNTLKPWNDALWNTTQERILAIKPSLVRLPLMRSWFNSDDNGNQLPIGTYNWNSKYMQAYYKIMDLYKEHDIKVMSGLWHAVPSGYLEGDFYESDDFAKLQGDLLEYLFKTKGYDKIITVYAPTNEPLGCSVSITGWSNMCKKLYSELQKKGLPTNIITGADSWGDWIWKPAQYNSNELSAYDFHNYLNDTPDDTYNSLYNRTIEPIFESNLANIRKHDAFAKPIHVSEMAPIGVPFIDWPVSDAPAYCRIDTYEYALGFWDYGIQLARSGMSSGLAWGLDGFEQNKNAGMWNNAGTYGGMTLRPWYYTWQLMCRYFPREAKIIKMKELENRKDLRILGAKIGESDYSFVVVNRRMDTKSDCATITFKLPIGAKRFYLYEFNPAQCGNGVDLSLPYKVLDSESMENNGLTVDVPLESGVLLTTMPPLTSGSQSETDQLSIDFEGDDNFTLIAQSFYGASISKVTNPRKRGLNVSDNVCQVEVKKKDEGFFYLDDTFGAIVPLNNIKISASNKFLTFQTYKNVASKITVAISIEGSNTLKGCTVDAIARNWQEWKLNLSQFVGQRIKHIAIFPDRNFYQSINTNTYLSIDNINLVDLGDGAIDYQDIILNEIDNSLKTSLNIDFENLTSSVILDGTESVINTEVVSNPKILDANKGAKVCKALMLSSVATSSTNHSKFSLNPYPGILLTRETPNLTFQVYRQNNICEGKIEVAFKSGKKVMENYSLNSTRKWLTFGIGLTPYIGEIITNISVYPNLNYVAERLGTEDISFFDNFVLSNAQIGGAYVPFSDSDKLFIVDEVLHVVGAEGATITIANIDGTVFHYADSINNEFMIKVPKGVLIVKLNNKRYKLIN